MTIFTVRATVLALILITATAILRSCDRDDSITDCSKRNQPQRHDGQKWTCK